MTFYFICEPAFLQKWKTKAILYDLIGESKLGSDVAYVVGFQQSFWKVHFFQASMFLLLSRDLSALFCC